MVALNNETKTILYFLRAIKSNANRCLNLIRKLDILYLNFTSNTIEIKKKEKGMDNNKSNKR
jgi:hypothetical protein